MGLMKSKMGVKQTRTSAGKKGYVDASTQPPTRQVPEDTGMRAKPAAFYRYIPTKKGRK